MNNFLKETTLNLKEYKMLKLKVPTYQAYLIKNLI